MRFHRSLQSRGLFACHCEVTDGQILVGILFAKPDEELSDFPILIDQEIAQVQYQVCLLGVSFETINYNFVLRLL